jgi:hypothetical protein
VRPVLFLATVRSRIGGSVHRNLTGMAAR